MEITHASLLTQKIIHLDMDAFYAAVETRENPALEGRPVVVGGQPNGRGVVSTANYEARRFGIHSAMPAKKAYRLCPHAVFVRPNFQLYKKASQDIKNIMRRITPLVEPLSLDEAYLDVTEPAKSTTATKIADRLRRVIFEETGLVASAGVAPNKMIAKIASDFDKPNGLKVVQPGEVRDFMLNLPVRKIPGIGPVSAKKLNGSGIKTCGDVLQYRATILADWGRFGRWLVKRAQGIDERRVQTSWLRKSVGHESTFFQDLSSISDVEDKLRGLASQVVERLIKSKVKGRTITLKVRYNDFTTLTRSMTIKTPTDNIEDIESIVLRLVQQTEAGKIPVRLLGISLTKLDNKKGGYIQPSLF